MTARCLAAILSADVVGFSRLIGTDEATTLSRLRALRTDTIDPLMAEHHGRIFKTTGDGPLAEFPSAVQALRCAIAIQEWQRADQSALVLRIGLERFARCFTLLDHLPTPSTPWSQYPSLVSSPHAQKPLHQRR